MKQSRPGVPVPNIILKQYTPDRRLCVVHALNEYLRRTEKLRGQNKSLFVSYLKPYNNVTTTTISHWLRNVMFFSGIDTSKFKSHSVRSASASRVKLKNIPVSEIMKVAGWSSEQTFSIYYNKPIIIQEFSYANALLSGN